MWTRNLDELIDRVVEWVVHLIIAAALIAIVFAGVVGIAFAQVPESASKHRREYVRIVHAELGLDAPIATLAGQLAQESGWRDGLTSRVGARGMAQFMPATATWINELAPQLQSDAIYSPRWSMRAQVVFMGWLAKRVKPAANACERMGFALAGYNGGERRVRQRQALSKRPGYCFNATCRINPGIHPANQRENEEYPERIEHRWAPRFVTAGWGKRSCANT